MAPAILTRVEETLELNLSPCKGYEFKDNLARARDIPGKRFDYDRKLWCYAAEPEIADRILRTIVPVEASDDLVAWVREARMKQTEDLTTPLPDDAKLLIPWAERRMPWQPSEVNDEKFNGLLAWQRAAVDHLARNPRAILADDMGLGKTFEGISATEEWCLLNATDNGLTLPEGPRIVVAPNSVKGGWLRELTRWLDDPPVQVVDGSTANARHNQIAQGIRDNAWVIVNWEMLRVKREKVKVKRRDGFGYTERGVWLMKEPLLEYPGAVDWDLKLSEWTWREHSKAKRGGLTEGWLAALADEAHRAKNRKALQTRGLWRLNAKIMLALTGTPIMNAPDELYPLLHWLFPMEFNSYEAFDTKYVDSYEIMDGRGRMVIGVKNPDALRLELKGRLIRRTAKLLNLKGRRRIYYDVELNPNQRKLYEDAEREMWLQVFKEAEAGDEGAAKFAAEAEGGATLANLIRIPNGAARMTRLLQIIENAALVGGDDDSAIMDDLEEKIDESGPDAQWVVGFKYKDSCELMAKRLRAEGISVGVYTGDVDPADRTKLEDAFQAGKLRVLIGTLDATKEGITLTSGHLMYMGSLFFVPDLNEQWEARCDRLGQQELVRVFIPQAKDSVATGKVEPILRKKSKIVRQVVPKHEIQEVRS